MGWRYSLKHSPLEDVDGSRFEVPGQCRNVGRRDVWKARTKQREEKTIAEDSIGSGVSDDLCNEESRGGW